MLQLTLLGPAQINLNGRSISNHITGKGLALFVYLAVTGQAHARDTLFDLFWRDMSSVQASNNLRTILPTLRKVVGAHLIIGRQTVAFNKEGSYWLDVEVFRSQVMASANQTNIKILQEILKLYQGDFLAGFHVRNAPDFEEWVARQSEELHALAIQGFQRLADYYLKQDDYAAGLGATKQLLALEPWHEIAHRQQMLFLAHIGQQKAALAQYTICQRILAEELDTQPSAETKALYEQIRNSELGTKEAEKLEVRAEFSATALPPSPLTSVSSSSDWEKIPRAPIFYGQQYEVNTLRNWVITDQCRLVGIFGIGGQGKTTLVRHLLRTQVGEPPLTVAGQAREPGINGYGFDHVIQYSLVDAPSLHQIIQDWLQRLGGQQAITLPQRLDEQLALLLDYLRRQRCLLVLDNLESIMQGGEYAGHYRPGYEAYGELLYQVGESHHQSCLLLISRERPMTFARLEESTPAIRSLQLSGLALDIGVQLLRGGGLTAPDDILATLVRRYSGHPQALIVVAETINDLFAGDIENFLAEETLIFGDIKDILDQQFARLSLAEQEILIWLAIKRKPTSLTDLWEEMMSPYTKSAYLEAQRSLLRRSLIEPNEKNFSLQNVIIEYLTDHLVEGIYEELIDDRILLSQSLLSRYALGKIHKFGNSQENQARSIFLAIAKRLTARLGKTGAIEKLRFLLETLCVQVPWRPGYAINNLLLLLLYFGINLQKADFERYMNGQGTIGVASDSAYVVSKREWASPMTTFSKSVYLTQSDAE